MKWVYSELEKNDIEPNFSIDNSDMLVKVDKRDESISRIKGRVEELRRHWNGKDYVETEDEKANSPMLAIDNKEEPNIDSDNLRVKEDEGIVEVIQKNVSKKVEKFTRNSSNKQEIKVEQLL